MIRLFIFLGFLLIAIASSYAEFQLEWPGFEQIRTSAISLGLLYAFFRLFLDTLVAKRISDSRSAYRFRKTIGILLYLFSVLALFRIWIENPEALLVSYGIVAAGAAIALQDLIKNFAGGVVIILNNLFRVGDRVEVSEIRGDIIDIGIFNTVMFEVGNWVAGDQATGRVVSVPNGIFLSQNVINYTRDHEYIWDEVMIPITYGSDWKKASKSFVGIAERRTLEFQEPAQHQMKRMARKYYVTERETKPQVYIENTDNWIEIHLRYITKAKERRNVGNDIKVSILKSTQKSPDITIASQTVDIVGFPKK